MSVVVGLLLRLDKFLGPQIQQQENLPQFSHIQKSTAPLDRDGFHFHQNFVIQCNRENNIVGGINATFKIKKIL